MPGPGCPVPGGSGCDGDQLVGVPGNGVHPGAAGLDPDSRPAEVEVGVTSDRYARAMTLFPARGLGTAGGRDPSSIARRQTRSARPMRTADAKGVGRRALNAGYGADTAFPHTHVTALTEATGTGSWTQRRAWPE
jgi:hypothetical protein